MGRPPRADGGHDDASEAESTESAAKASTDTDPLGELVAKLDALSDDQLQELPRKSGKAARLVQAETDRREAKRTAEQAARNPADAATLQRIADLKARERQVRSSDPYEAAQLRDQMEQLEGGLQATQAQQTQLHGLVKATVVEYDKSTLTPLLEVLSEGDRAAILADVPDDLLPFEQRKEVVSRALKAYEKAVRADEAKKTRDRLAKNPAERKQVVLGLREEEDEPDLVTSAGTNGTSGGTDMNTYLRGVLGMPSPRRRR